MLATVDMYMANIEQSDNMVALHNLSVNTKKQLLWEPNLIYKFFLQNNKQEGNALQEGDLPTLPGISLKEPGGGRTIVSQSTHLLAFATWVQEGAITLDD